MASHKQESDTDIEGKSFSLDTKSTAFSQNEIVSRQSNIVQFDLSMSMRSIVVSHDRQGSLDVDLGVAGGPVRWYVHHALLWHGSFCLQLY